MNAKNRVPSLLLVCLGLLGLGLFLNHRTGTTEGRARELADTSPRAAPPPIPALPSGPADTQTTGTTASATPSPPAAQAPGPTAPAPLVQTIP
jgi:hypothetical protein